MLSKSSAVVRAMSKARAFSSSATSGGGRKMQKLFIDYLEEAQKRQGVKAPTDAVPNVPKVAPQKEVKKEKQFIDYLDDAEAKIAAKKGQV